MISFFQIKTWREEQVYGCAYRACLACWTTIVIFCETELHQVTVGGSAIGVAALESVAGPGKAAVAAVKGKIGGIAEAVGMKTPSTNTGNKAADTAFNSIGSALLKTTEDVAGNKINHEIKESKK